MLMYYLVESNKNYLMTPESLWNYYRDEVNDAANNIINNKATKSRSFAYKTKIIGILPGVEKD